jgi:mono/diheme cytochrome c family protein
MVSVQRVELYLDGNTQPLAVLDRPPFRFALDTGTLASGGHALRLSISYADGSRDERSHLFEVSGGEALALEDVGFLPGRGVVTIDLSGELEPAGHAPSRPLLGALVVGALLLITLGVQGFMALGSRPAPGRVPPAAAPAPAPTAAARPPASEAGAPARDGAALYLEHCSSCHQPDGRGVEGVFSGLVGPHVADADSVIARVINGGGAMPPFAELSDVELAAILTHVRTAWGNGYGPVRPEDVAARR